MSAHTAAHDHEHSHDLGDVLGDDGGEFEAHGSRRSYLIGFGASVVLTAIPFWLVMTGVLGSTLATGLMIMALAGVQVVVHMVLFLHMDTKAEGGWSFMALTFTVIVVVIALSGSLWVMYHLNTNMMPMTQHDMSRLP